MAFNLKQYQAIYDDIKAYIIGAQDRISDFTAGSVIASEVEAFAREMALLYSDARAGFSEVLAKLAFSVFSIQKHEAQYATGSCTFSRSVTTSTAIVPLGTQVSTSGGVIYETQETATMGEGVSSITVPVKAVDSGKSGNVPAGTIVVIISGLSGVDFVTNQSSVGGGVNEETDAEYLLRFKTFLLGLGKSNRWGIIYAALLNPSIRSASLVEHFPPKNGFYNFTLYLDDGSGTVSPETIETVAAIVDGNGTTDSPGYRAAGINADYLAPTSVPVDVTGTVVVSFAVDLSEAKAILETITLAHLNAKTIGEDVVRAQIQKVILNNPWVLDLDITVPVANIAIGQNQIARAGTISLTVSQSAGE
jgi:uncharacterized phage protein gp47/JayE